MAYDKNKNYQEEIDQAVARGDYAAASRAEQERNEKIDGEGLPYEKTNKYVIPNGVSDDAYNQSMSKHKVSDDVLAKGDNRNNAANRVNSVTNKDNIVSEGVYSTINRQYTKPYAVTQADAYLSEQLSKIQSGKTSFSDQVRETLDKIMNREKFSYDVDTDPLFQQALASAMNSGKQAMQDTIGQASALTGGYGSTYATTAGNQAYNAFIEDAYDNLPQYYEMAMNAYQMEGDELYRQYSMLSTEDEKEYNRNLTAYDATFNYRNQLNNEAYTQFRDTKADAINYANLQLNEHGQLVNDAYTAYNVASAEETTAYERDYQSWADSINQAMQMAGIQNSDWWNQANQDFTASENQKNRDFQAAEAEKDRAFTASENAKNRAASIRGGGGGSGGGGYDLIDDWIGNNKIEELANSTTVKQFQNSILKEDEFDKNGKKGKIDGKFVRFDSYDEYVAAEIEQWMEPGWKSKKSGWLPSAYGNLTEEEATYLIRYYGLQSE